MTLIFQGYRNVWNFSLIQRSHSGLPTLPPLRTNDEMDPVTQATSTDEDIALVARAQAGDSAAFDVLLRKYQHRVLGVIGRYVKDWSECQDVAQDVFVRVYRALPGFRGDSSFSSWIHRIAVNTAFNHLDARKRRPPGTDVDFADAELSHGLDGHYLSSGESPEQEALRQELAQVLNAQLAQLPPDLRSALMMRELDGLSYEEIAQQMNTPIGTVRSRIFRAREAMDAVLRRHLHGDLAPRDRESGNRKREQLP